MKLIKRIDYLAALKAVKGAPGSGPCEYVEVNMSWLGAAKMPRRFVGSKVSGQIGAEGLRRADRRDCGAE